ncbi:MAG: hypothetical protein IKZ61_09590 [Prevotella sp.]|nr:hypothetical protein [Prevotella sp.]
MKKLDIEEYVLPSDISDSEKEMIISKCKEDCSNDVVEKINNLLKFNK